MDDREWVEENTADIREEVRASTSELKEIDKIMGPALDKNKKLPKSAVCNQPNAVYLFNIAPDVKTWVWQYPVPAKAKQKVAERLKEWCKNGWSKPAVPGNCNNNPLLAIDKKSAGVVAFDDIRLCIDTRQLNTLNRTKKCTYMLPRIADILKKAQKVKTRGVQVCFCRRRKTKSFGNPEKAKAENSGRLGDCGCSIKRY